MNTKNADTRQETAVQATGNADASGIAALMQALADVNRLRILNLLLQEKELCVCDIERVLAVPQTRVSRHLTILRNSGWVAARREGRWMHYRLTDDSPLQRELTHGFRKQWRAVPEFMQDIARLQQPTIVCCDPLSENHP
ncbi:MAG: helix-turn-helix transcriptional regulator [Bacteroidetes bacterium]|nr:helix-turn-helix transcriptional regulator [Bacteroidota bacterium]